MSTAITPTPGRTVWFHPAPNDNIPALAGQPLAAIIAAVHSDRYINLSVIDAYGHHHSAQSVYLAQPGDEAVPVRHAEWMPYQLSQATKNALADNEELASTGKGPAGNLAVDGAGVSVTSAVTDDGTEGGSAD